MFSASAQSQDIPLIQGPIVSTSSTSLELTDVSVDANLPFHGLDSAPADMATRVPLQVQSDLESWLTCCYGVDGDSFWLSLQFVMFFLVGVIVRDTSEEQYNLMLTLADDVRGLATRIALKEGQVICNCPAVLLSDLPRVVTFLKLGSACT